MDKLADMGRTQPNYALRIACRIDKKEIFLWRVGHDYRYNVRHRVAVHRCRRQALEEKQRYFRFRIRRNKAWHHAALNRSDALWAFKIRRML